VLDAGPLHSFLNRDAPAAALVTPASFIFTAENIQAYIAMYADVLPGLDVSFIKQLLETAGYPLDRPVLILYETTDGFLLTLSTGVSKSFWLSSLMTTPAASSSRSKKIVPYSLFEKKLFTTESVTECLDKIQNQHILLPLSKRNLESHGAFLSLRTLADWPQLSSIVLRAGSKDCMCCLQSCKEVNIPPLSPEDFHYCEPPYKGTSVLLCILY